MKLSDSIKSVSYLKTHVSEIMHQCRESQATYIITQNGEASAVLQDIKTYEETQEALDMLKLLALSEDDIKHGRTTPIDEVFSELRKQIVKDKKNAKL